MLTLVLTLAVSQSTVLDDPPPPPPPLEAAPDQPLASPALTPARLEVHQPPPRAARLLTEEPRVSGGALAGRVGMSIGLGLVS